MIKILTSDIWTTESVHSDVDGDITLQYADFAIAFESEPDSEFDGEYYVAAGGLAFPELSGQWKFDSNLKKLFLGNGRDMDVTISETKLTLIFTVAPSGESSRGLRGRLTFKLKKNKPARV